MEYVAYIVFPWFGSFEVARSEKNGGSVTYSSIEQLKADYTAGNLHPGGWVGFCGVQGLCGIQGFFGVLGVCFPHTIT